MAARFMKDRSAGKGAAPGTAIFIGKQKEENVRLRVIDFDSQNLFEEEIKKIEDAALYQETDTVTWINIDGLHDTELIKRVGSIFKLHSLLLEDISNTAQRPKIEEYDNCLLITLKMLRFDKKKDRDYILSEQFSLVLTDRFVITFQERQGDVFEPVRERIRKGKGRIRLSGPDYLAYALCDTIVDNYIYLIEHLGEKIEEIEDSIIDNPTNVALDQINYYKRELNYVRKAVRPAWELTNELVKSESPFISEKLFPFLRDLHDLTVQANEAIETYREMLTDQLTIYHTSVSNAMNDVMKVLTIFAAIFIPLTFIAGIYGTNFDYLPELHYKYSYFIFWGVMILGAASMIVFFKRKKWM